MTDLQAKRLTMMHLRLMLLAGAIEHQRRDIYRETKFGIDLGIKPALLQRLRAELESSEWTLEALRSVYKEKMEGILNGRFT